jgi:hypothetical protein
MYNNVFNLNKKRYHDEILTIALSDIKSRFLSRFDEKEIRILAEPNSKVFYSRGNSIYSPDIFVQKGNHDIIYEIKSMKNIYKCMHGLKGQLEVCKKIYGSSGRHFSFILVKPRTQNPKKPRNLELITIYESKALDEILKLIPSTPAYIFEPLFV